MRNAAFVLVLASLLGLGGCFGGGAPPRTYFTLQYPIDDAAQAYSGARFPINLRVRRLDIGLAYDKQEIVYRTSPYEFQYYWFKLWASKPQKILTEVVADHLGRAQIARTVSTEILDRVPDYELQGEVIAIEELDADEVWFAHLALRFTLVRFSDRQAVWSREFEDRERVYERQPVFVVRSLSNMLERQMRALSDELGEVLAIELAGKGTLSKEVTVPEDLVPETPPAVPEVKTKPVKVEPKAKETKDAGGEEKNVPKTRFIR